MPFKQKKILLRFKYFRKYKRKTIITKRYYIRKTKKYKRYWWYEFGKEKDNNLENIKTEKEAVIRFLIRS